MAKSKNKSKKSKIDILLLIIGVVLLVTSFIIKYIPGVKPILWFIGAILIIVFIIKKYRLNKMIALFIFICIFIISVVLDGLTVIYLKKIPIFAYNIINTKTARVYNGIGVRVWQCDKNNDKDLIIDLFYNKGYMCNAEDLDTIDSNAFLNSVVENYSDYKDSFVKINGRISKKTGQNYIEMKPYETKNITINGYVSFADNITLRILFNENEPELDNYDVYDEITIIGKVKNLEESNGRYVIYMYDSKVASSIFLNDYSISVTTDDKCMMGKDIIFSNENSIVYTYCLNNITVSYPDNKKYDLANVLSSNKLTIDQIINDSNNTLKNTEDESIIYEFNDFNILVCDKSLSKDVIIGDKTMNFTNATCDSKVQE